MSTLLLAIVVIAGLACPIHMLWQTRRGRRGCIGARGGDRRADAIRQRQRALDRQLAALRDLQTPRSAGDGR